MRKIIIAIIATFLLTSSVSAQFLMPGNRARLRPVQTAPITRNQLNFKITSPLDFGAKCDGVTDDTSALKTWLSTITVGTKIELPNNFCVFSIALAFPNVNYVSIYGSGERSGFLYNGSSTSIPRAITIGPTSIPASGCGTLGWALNNFRIMSNTTMTAGDGLYLGWMCEADIVNLKVGGDLDNDGIGQNWYNAIHFNGGNSIHMRGYSFSASNIGEIINGDSTNQFTDMYQSGGGKIAHTAIGLNIAGNVGGFTLDHTDILENGIDIKIDQSQVAISNNQIFLGPGVALDTTSFGPDIDITDAGSANALLVITGSWIATAHTHCIYFESNVEWRFIMTGGIIVNCVQDGIRTDSANSWINISGTTIGDPTYKIGGYGINATVGLANLNLSLNGIYWNGTTSGNTSANMPYGAALSSYSAIGAGVPHVNVRANTVVGINAAVQEHWVGGTANSFITWSLSDNNGTPTYGLTLGSGVTSFTIPGVAISANPHTQWAEDFSGNTTVVSNGSCVTFPAGSGIISVNNPINGDTALYIAGGGNVSLVSSTVGSFVSPTCSPASTKSSVCNSGSNYEICNNTGGSVTYAVALMTLRHND